MVALDWLPANPALRPRMKMLPGPGPLSLKVTFGMYLSTSSNGRDVQLLQLIAG